MREEQAVGNEVMEKGKSDKAQSIAFRAGCLSQDQHDNPKGGLPAGFTQHTRSLWKSRKGKPYPGVVRGKEWRRIDLSAVSKVYFKRISLPNAFILWATAQDKRVHGLQQGVSSKSESGGDPSVSGALTE